MKATFRHLIFSLVCTLTKYSPMERSICLDYSMLSMPKNAKYINNYYAINLTEHLKNLRFPVSMLVIASYPIHKPEVCNSQRQSINSQPSELHFRSSSCCFKYRGNKRQEQCICYKSLFVLYLYYGLNSPVNIYL